MVNIIQEPTCYHHAGGLTLIDHIVTTDPELYVQNRAIPTLESDHDIIFAARKKFTVKTEKNKITIRRYKNFKEEAFVRDIADLNWTRVLTTPDPWKTMTFELSLPVWITEEYLSDCKEHDT